jgi:hypothetical protein
MDVVTGPRSAAGVFRLLLHVVEADGRSIDFEGIRLWFAYCGAACVLLDEEPPGRRERCPICFR